MSPGAAPWIGASPFRIYHMSHNTCTVKPVLSDHIKQDMLLAFQTGCCL